VGRLTRRKPQDPRDYYTKLLDCLIRSPYVTGVDLKLYALLTSRSTKYEDRPRHCNVPKRVLQLSMQMSRSSLNRSLQRLQDLGLLRVTYDTKNMPTYLVLEPPPNICPPELMTGSWKDALCLFDALKRRKKSTQRANYICDIDESSQHDYCDPDSDCPPEWLAPDEEDDYSGFPHNITQCGEFSDPHPLVNSPPSAGASTPHPLVRHPHPPVDVIKSTEEDYKEDDYTPNGVREFADANSTRSAHLVGRGFAALRAAEAEAKNARAKNARGVVRAKKQEREEKPQETTGVKKEKRGQKAPTGEIIRISSFVQRDRHRNGTPSDRRPAKGIDGRVEVPETPEQIADRLKRSRSARTGTGTDGQRLDVSASSETKGERSAFEQTKEVSSELSRQKSEMSGGGPRRQSAAESYAERSKKLEAAMEAAINVVDAAPQEPWRFYGFLSYQVAAKFPGVRLTRPGQKELRMCSDLITRYSPEELFEMVRIMVLDWDNICHGPIFMAYKIKSGHPNLLFLCANAMILHSHIGRGVASGGGRRYSEYASDYTQRKGSNTSEPASEMTPSPIKRPVNPDIDWAIEHLLKDDTGGTSA